MILLPILGIRDLASSALSQQRLPIFDISISRRSRLCTKDSGGESKLE